MEAIESLLSNPLSGLIKDAYADIQTKFEILAKTLFENYAIKCGKKHFRLAEIEFYYYKKEEWNADWNKETYPRNNKKAGDFFFHYSGADICFKSHFDSNSAEFGGILIRSLLDGDDILAGPSYCANLMLNTCEDRLPNLVPAEHKDYDIRPTKRHNIASDKKDDMKLKLCYYVFAANGQALDWTNTSIRKDWDKNQEKLKPVKRNYQQERNF